jgi:hypothetical protein
MAKTRNVVTLARQQAPTAEIARRRQWVFALGTMALATSGCLCPPCGADVAEVQVVPPGSRLIIWNGDDVRGSAQGWGECDSHPKCKVTIELVEKQGVDGSAALRIHGQGGGWLGGGWNWFNWWPENAGTDLSQFDDLVFSMRVVAKEPKLRPEPGGITVGLGCSNGKKTSPFAPVAQRAKTLTDGNWHRLSIPLSEFRKGKLGKAFDMATAWEFKFSVWNDSPREFDMFIDDLAAEKRL